MKANKIKEELEELRLLLRRSSIKYNRAITTRNYRVSADLHNKIVSLNNDISHKHKELEDAVLYRLALKCILLITILVF